MMKTRPSRGSLARRIQTANPAPAGSLHPRFLRELVCVPFGEEVIVDGSDRLHILRTGPNRHLLLKLISLMDGSRTPSDLAACFPDIPRGDVHDAISMLSSYGLLEDGSPDREGNSNVATLSFMRRFLGVMHAHRNGPEAYRKLQSSRVAIFVHAKTSPVASLAKDLLEKTGVAPVELFSSESLHRGGRDAAILDRESLVVGLSSAQEEGQWLPALDEWCFERGITWFRSVVDETAEYVDFGPTFKILETPCYRCLQAMHLQPLDLRGSPAQRNSALDRRFVASMLAVEIIYLLSRLGPVAAGRDLRRFSLAHGEWQILRCSRLPGCSRCQLHDGMDKAFSPAHTDTIDTAIVFEDYAGLPSRSAAPTKQLPEEHALAQLYESKRFLNCRHIKLAQHIPDLRIGILDVLKSESRNSEQPLTLDELKTMLLATGGIRDAHGGILKIKRWAATAGNLGSVELWLAVRNVEGLSPGYYYYQPHDHSLACFQRHSGTLAVPDFIRRVLPTESPRLPDALVLFTGAFHRVARKYGPFAYRLVNLDAGAAVSQLHMVARCLEVESRTASRWADDLIEEQLNLQSFAEHCTAAVPIYRGNRGGLEFPESPRQTQVQPGTPFSAKPPYQLGRLPVERVLEMTYRESRVKEEELRLGPYQVPSGLLTSCNEEPVNGKALPSPRCGGELVSTVLRKRTSVRHYTCEPVSLDQIATMLACARLGDVHDWPEEQDEGQALTFLVLSWKANGLDPGVYRYDAQNHTLILSRPAPSPEDTVELFVQEEFAAAPLVVWVTGNLAAACARHGALGHRLMLLRAGAAAHRLWMAALGMDLAGTIVAGVIPGAARQQLGLDGYKRASFIAVALGHGVNLTDEPFSYASGNGSSNYANH